jgi:hypothetical protein
LVLKIVALTALVSTAYTLTLLDQLVNDTLYSYGLQFSYTWANSYWTLLRVAWALLAISAVAITINTILIIRPRSKEKDRSVRILPTQKMVTNIPPTAQTRERVPVTSHAPSPQLSAKPPTKPTPIVAPESPYSSPEATSLFRCTHCGKTFTQPLRMLNFQVDPPRIVNVCPFCNETMPTGTTVKESEQAENRTLFRKNNGHIQKPLTQ